MRPVTSLRPALRYLRRRGRRALGCFEDREDSGWVCIRAIFVMGPAGPIPVQKGRSFAPKTVFAGIDDFPSYLASVSVESAPSAPHESRAIRSASAGRKPPGRAAFPLAVKPFVNNVLVMFSRTV